MAGHGERKDEMTRVWCRGRIQCSAFASLVAVEVILAGSRVPRAVALRSSTENL